MGRKKHPKLLFLLTALALVVSTAFTADGIGAPQEKYPSRPIQVIIPYQPGSGDVGLRPFTEKLPDYIGQPVPFVYKPGAGGALAASFVAKAKRDGYTLIGASSAPVLYSPLVKEGLDYTLDDFAPICRLARTPLILAVKADSPWKTIKDLVEAAKKAPGKLTYSSAGALGVTHLTMEQFSRVAGVNLTQVPCAGSAPAVTALLGGHVDMSCSSMAPIVPHLKSGALRAVGFFEAERLKEFSGVPTFMELGYSVVRFTWYGFMGPKGIPEEVVKTLFLACKRVVEEHRNFVEDRLGKASLKLDFLNPEEFASRLKEENEVLKPLVKDVLKASTK